MALLLGAGPAFSAVVEHELDAVMAFNIPPLSLDLALLEYSRQTGVQVISSAEPLRGRSTRGLQGSVSPRVALERLLQGTGLSFVVAEGRTVTIMVAAPVRVGAQSAASQAAITQARLQAPGPAASAAPAAPPPPAADQLEEVVVTATRQASTVNRVPLSVSAVTQRSLDQQGIKTVDDLQRSVPSLVVTNDRAGASNFSIRGVVSTVGAATVGIYLNDTPIMKRRIGGGGNAAPGGGAPPLFDLERVEVLRGPQGTLYGGSSQGGTIRFITPQPSLTRYSAYARGEVSTVKEGEMGWEGGVAVGGPIVADKLGFRASYYRQHVGGFIDIVDPYNNGAMKFEDSNDEDTEGARFALAWRPTDRSLVTLSGFSSLTKSEGAPDQWLLPQPPGKVFTTVTKCYNTAAPPAATGPGQTACPAAGQPLPANIYRRPGESIGPFDYLSEPYQSFATRLVPERTMMRIYDLTLDYAFDKMAVKSITSYIYDKTVEWNIQGSVITNQFSTTDFPTVGGFTLYPSYPDYERDNKGFNKRTGLVQEIRFNSTDTDSPLSWVAGVYYSNIRGNSYYFQPGDLNKNARIIFGRRSALDAFGVNFDLIGTAASRLQTIKDVEMAAFGEGTYSVTDKLKAIAGVRVARVSLDYFQALWGGFNWLDPYNNPSGIAQGSVSESPVTPKFGLQYQVTDNDMVYLTAAKGYRTGGVNTSVIPVICGQGLANIGLTVDDVPKTFKSDTIWSYEAGGKFRLLNGRMQLNSSVFRIDWSDLQLVVPNIGFGCGGGWIQNAGRARSQGFDADVQARLFGRLSINAGIGYTDAKYITQVQLPPPLNGAAPTVILRKGDTIPIPPWQFNFGAQYDFELGSRRGFVRGDFTYQSGEYLRGSAPGVAGFAADTAYADHIRRLNLRAGFNLTPAWQVNVFANNALNAKDEVSKSGGRTGCAPATGAACTTFSSYNPLITVSYGRPREIGIQTSYRY